jgi:SAM-dependent methyltransferase
MAHEQGTEIRLAQADVRELPFAEEFDVVMNAGTSFGWFDDAGNQRVLDGLAACLRPGGQLVIDTLNLFRLARSFIVPARWEPLDDQGGIVTEDRHYDFVTGRRLVNVTAIHADGRRTELSHSIRVYTMPELALMLGRSGLIIESAWGDLCGAPYDFEARRMVAIARKVDDGSVHRLRSQATLEGDDR